MSERWVPNGSATPIQCCRTVPPGPCHYALLLRRAARRMLAVEAEVLCSVSPRKRVGQFFVGRVTAGGRRDGGRPRVLSSWKGEVV